MSMTGVDGNNIQVANLETEQTFPSPRIVQILTPQ